MGICISKDIEFVENELTLLIKERGEKILERFGQVVVSQIKEPKLLAALEDVKGYWRDLNRPTLTSLACEAVGGNLEAAEDAGLMFTLASAGFGIHDDILDKSLHKHLRKTILGLHGIDVALLLGDLLIVKGWSTIHELLRKTCDPTKIADIMQTYGNLSVEVCEAELMETQCRKKIDTELDFYENILWKEMAETEVCCRIGAMIGNGSPREIEALSEFGRRIGFNSRLANEIEDCLNIKGDLLHRIQYESVPLPLLYAAKSSPEIYLKIEKIVHKNKVNSLDVKSLLKLCFDTDAFGYIRTVAKKNEAKAMLLLDSLKVNTARQAFQLLNRVAYERVDTLCI